jgi:methylglyoxal synthase
MKIILLADTSRNELLVNFCVAYQQILAKHELVSPINTARLIDHDRIRNLALAKPRDLEMLSQFPMGGLEKFFKFIRRYFDRELDRSILFLNLL